MKETINFKLNGKSKSINVDTNRNLLWFLRAELGMTGTKFGCGINYCGSCTVVVDNEAVKSCNYPVRNIKNKEVITIEGLAKNGKLHPIQEGFVEHSGMQCGFCTPGMIMRAYGMIQNNPKPSRDEIIEEMDNNICRCGAHTRIIQAIETATK